MLEYAGGEYFLVVLIQTGSTELWQYFYHLKEDQSWTLERQFQTLELDTRSWLELYPESGTILLSCAGVDIDVTACTSALEGSVKEVLFPGNINAGSRADMSFSGLDAMKSLFGDPEPAVTVNAHAGLFMLDIGESYQQAEIFGIRQP